MKTSLRHYVRTVLGDLLKEDDNIPCRLTIRSPVEGKKIIDAVFPDGQTETPAGMFKKGQVSITDSGIEILGDLFPARTGEKNAKHVLTRYFEKLFAKNPLEIEGFDIALLQRINERE
tara:strand:- start:282 stop:635 length:354 start_codon:yes stop_codon:yes gene_type:complete